MTPRPTRRPLKTLLAAALLLFPLAGVTQKSPAKQTAKPAPAPTAAQIIERFVRVTGGRDNYLKLTTRVMKGTVTLVGAGQELSGTIEAYQKAPNYMLIVTEISGVGTGKEGYDGKVAWAHDPQDGLKELSGAERAEAVRDSDFYEELNLQKRYASLKVNGTVRLGEQEAYLVEGSFTDGQIEKLYFDVATGLLVRKDTVSETPDGRQPMEINLENHALVDGIRLPFTRRTVLGSVTLLVRLSQIQHNVPLADSLFAKPSTP